MDDLLEQRLEIETPERVLLVQDLAGIGSRFAACAVDACVLALPCIAVFCGVLAFIPLRGHTTEEEIQVVALAAVGTASVLLWLYFLVFESLWGGRTPGKRALRLRVMSVHGGPAPVSSMVLRNLVRIVDSMPMPLCPLVAGTTMFLTGRSQRLGDLFAGTVVVRERPEALRVPRLRAEEDRGEELAPVDLEEVDRFVARRGDLLAVRRREIAAELVGRLRAAYALPQGDAETILGLLHARRTPQQLRDLAGPRAAPPEPAAAPPAERSDAP